MCFHEMALGTSSRFANLINTTTSNVSACEFYHGFEQSLQAMMMTPDGHFASTGQAGSVSNSQ